MKKRIISIAILVVFISSMTVISSAQIITSNYNTPPNPPIVNGPSAGKIKEVYQYDFYLTDPDEGDYLTSLEIDFGDDVIVMTKRNCEKPWTSGKTLSASHSWDEQGEYLISARVSDSNGDWSEWSIPFPVSMPKLKGMPNIYILLQKFSLLQRILFY